MKNTTLAGVLGFFVLGLFYGMGFNTKSVLTVIGLCILSSIIATTVGPTLGLVVNIAGAYLGYKSAADYNAANKDIMNV